MAKWQAEIKVTNTGSYFPVTVEAGASYAAKETIQHIYDPISIRNLHQISSRSSSSSSSSDFDGAGAIGLVGLIAAGWLLMTFTPWILMLLGGAAATWLGQLITGQTLDEYTEREDDKGHGKFAIVLVLAILAGGFGFVKGDEIKKGFDSQDTPAQVKKVN
jgi:hypothetical protein